MVTSTQTTRPVTPRENGVGTENIAPTGADGRWKNYVTYLQKVIDRVQYQWEKQIIQLRESPVMGTQVSVKFVLNAEGKIARIVNVETTASKVYSRICISAVADRTPYARWTDEMRAVLGDEQEMTFTFYYQ